MGGSVTVLPKVLDEKVAQLHLGNLGVVLTTLSKDQADYINVAVTGPFKVRRHHTATDACVIFSFCCVSHIPPLFFFSLSLSLSLFQYSRTPTVTKCFTSFPCRRR